MNVRLILLYPFFSTKLSGNQEYDFNDYFSQQLCVNETTTTETPSLSDPTTYNTSEEGSTTTEDTYHEATTLPQDVPPTTEATHSGLNATTYQQDSLSSHKTDADITTIQSESLSPNGLTLSDTSSASNGNVGITPMVPIQSDTTATSGIGVDITPHGSPRCREVRVPLTNTTLTMKELEEAVEKIIDHLSVNIEELSSVKRSKISAPDDRVSSTTMGMGGIVFIVVVLGLVFVSDVSKLVHDLRSALGGTKKTKQ